VILERQPTNPGVILVTGAAGFIGSHVVEAMLAQGSRVVGLDNFDPFYSRTRKELNLKRARQSHSFRLVEGDICDRDLLNSLIEQEGPFDVIIHLAARAGVRPSISDPLGYERANVMGTTALLEMARSQSSLPKFLFASSSSVYGNNEKVPFCEGDSVDHPISPYAATKKACELMCHSYHHLYRIPVVCLRLFTVYGPRQRPDLAIHTFVRHILNDQPIEMYGDGSSSRDYTYISDIVAGISGAVAPCEGYEIINLGGTKPIDLRTMIRCIEQACGRSARVIEKPMQPGDVNRTYADISRATEILGYQPQTEFQQGVNEFVAWYRDVHSLS
jgi:UDP-glucuronate 4-epimerase